LGLRNPQFWFNELGAKPSDCSGDRGVSSGVWFPSKKGSLHVILTVVRAHNYTTIHWLVAPTISKAHDFAFKSEAELCLRILTNCAVGVVEKRSVLGLLLKTAKLSVAFK